MMNRTAQLGVVCLVLASAGCATYPQQATSPTGKSEPVQVKNVVILLDASGSMKKAMHAGSRTTRMVAAKAALKQVLATVPSDTQIGVLVFGAKNIRDYVKGDSSIGWAYALGPRDDAKLRKAIDLPIPKYKTPLGACIQDATDALSRQRRKQRGGGKYRLLIVTDGEADDPDLVDRSVPSAVSEGITIDVIGVAMKRTHTLATQVHKYYRANDPSALKKAVAQVFAEVADSGTDAAGVSAFDVIAPLPDRVAAAILSALSASAGK